VEYEEYGLSRKVLQMWAWLPKMVPGMQLMTSVSKFGAATGRNKENSLVGSKGLKLWPRIAGHMVLTRKRKF